MKHLIAASTFALTALFAAPAWAQTLEYGKDRLASDIASFILPANGSPENCQGACEANASCVAWTFVRAGWQGPTPRCYLKNPAPPPTDNICCVSGHK
jgi:PAN domain